MITTEGTGHFFTIFNGNENSNVWQCCIGRITIHKEIDVMSQESNASESLGVTVRNMFTRRAKSYEKKFPHISGVGCLTVCQSDLINLPRSCRCCLWNYSLFLYHFPRKEATRSLFYLHFTANYIHYSSLFTTHRKEKSEWKMLSAWLPTVCVLGFEMEK